MPFSHDEAKLIAGYMLANLEQERATTKRVIESVPAGQEDYSPDKKSMPALKLAWHIASAEKWFLDGIVAGEFKGGDDSGVPASIKTGADVAAWYEANLPAAVDAVKALTGEALTREIDFFGMMKWPALDYISLTLRHGIHHRGQLAAYLRPMGSKVPGIYGPSGDAS